MPVVAEMLPVRARAALVGAVVVLLGILAAAGTASAHAELLSSFPANQELLEVAPDEIALQFTEAVDPIDPAIRLLDASGDVVEIGAVDQSTGPDRIRASIPATLDDGTYVVAWQALSADSHRVRGSFTFSVGVPSAVTPGVLDGLFEERLVPGPFADDVGAGIVDSQRGAHRRSLRSRLTG
jgi:copper transport protein